MRSSPARCDGCARRWRRADAARCGADDRQALEQLCRYITRPALANERVRTNTYGRLWGKSLPSKTG
ncbi:MAG: transposase [Rubrivivax sp.]|nr:transposase [Rubrivivax sp.]MCW5632052.1 transposase [Rubrivivax sp.]